MWLICPKPCSLGLSESQMKPFTSPVGVLVPPCGYLWVHLLRIPSHVLQPPRPLGSLSMRTRPAPGCRTPHVQCGSCLPERALPLPDGQESAHPETSPASFFSISLGSDLLPHLHFYSLSPSWNRRAFVRFASCCVPGIYCVLSDDKVHLQCRRPGFDPWVEKIPWRRKWQPTPPVFLPGEFSGQRSLAGYSPWGCKKSHMTE